MEIIKKLEILSDAAKYDVSCASSGVARGAKEGTLGNSVKAGICHSFSADGRCISLLKILLTNVCIYDCKFCINKKTNDIPRATFTPKEICELTYNFYLRNYIEGLFLSSGIIKSPNYTMELLYKTIYMLRTKYGFNGYIHVKAIPGADSIIIEKLGKIVDRMSVNIELPSEKSLKLLAPDKSKNDVFTPMSIINNKIKEYKDNSKYFKNSSSFIKGGQSTQLIIGATKDSDFKMLKLTEALYNKFSLKRVYFSAYVPINSHPNLPSLSNQPPMLREHRLYQADFLLRFYQFKADEILNSNNPNFNRYIDPKCQYAINNLHLFPMEVNKVSYSQLLRIPGIGVTSAKRIISSRRHATLKFEDLKKMGIVTKRAKYFITCNSKYKSYIKFEPTLIENQIILQTNSNVNVNQISFFSKKIPLLESVSI